jgi:hypothetical protein
MHRRPIVADEHVPPLAPAALMAAIRLLVGTHLAQPFKPVPQARRKYPC